MTLIIIVDYDVVSLEADTLLLFSMILHPLTMSLSTECCSRTAHYDVHHLLYIHVHTVYSLQAENLFIVDSLSNNTHLLILSHIHLHHDVRVICCWLRRCCN